MECSLVICSVQQVLIKSVATSLLSRCETEGPPLPPYWRNILNGHLFAEFAKPLGKNDVLLGVSDLGKHTFEGNAVPED